MKPFTQVRIISLAGLACVMAAFIPLTFAGEAKGKEARAGRLEVMTQNLYVGANLFKILNPDKSIPENAAEIFGDILATDFWQRADAIADLVAEHEPHLIGLQEVSWIRTQCPFDPTTEATDEFADYLAILLAALSSRGLDYHVAAEVINADVELPVLDPTLQLLEGCPSPLFEARLTDRDVTLRRGDVDVTASFSGNYQAALPVPVPGGSSIDFIRGFNLVDVDLKGREYRFVNTHLEVSGLEAQNTFQFFQVGELVQTLDAIPAILGDKILVVVGDLNSDPEDGPLVACLIPPDFLCPTPYAVMQQFEYVDTWTVRNGAADPGYTCCQEDLLTNTYSWLDQRIDHVWVRPPLAGPQGPYFMNAVHATVVGSQQDNRSIDGLWPADHAGVVTGMTFRQKK